MLQRKKCSASICIVISLLIIFFINIVLYFLVDSGLLVNVTYDLLKKDQIRVANRVTELSPKKKTEKLPVKTSENVKRYVQKFLPVPKNGVLRASFNAAQYITATAKDVFARYKNTSGFHQLVLKTVLHDLEVRKHREINLSIAEKWVTGREVIPKSSPQLGSVLNKLCSSKILKADNSKKGTQLKLLLTLEGGYTALFKPKWYERETIIPEPVYSGKDRHNGEVAAFHLSLLLNLKRVPLTVGRRIDLRREVMPVATPALRATFFQEGNNTCFYGICYYCSPTDPVCAQKDIMEGALILWLPSNVNFSRYTHPWQRTYRNGLVARWELEEDYCRRVKKAKPYALNSGERILDLVDTAIFDFLIDNGDRHHYEAPANMKYSSVFLFDNGKSFGNPNGDHLDILAPLYQCCVIRKKTWESLLNFQGNVLGTSLEKTLSYSHISPVLTSAHLQALDRRLLLVYGAVEVCLRNNPHSAVIL